jgi:serine/threonine protein phosphatase PrpC
MYLSRNSRIGDCNVYLGGVLDGHDTHQASEFCSQNFPPLLFKSIVDKAGPIQRSANAVFEKLETDLTKSGSTSGTCVIGNLLLGQFVVNINLGDCRTAYVPLSSVRAPAAVGKVTWLSRDMQASAPYEVERIKACGGTIIDGRTAGVLEPSRTIGDADVKERQPPGVISIIPEYRICDVLTTGREGDDASTCLANGGAGLIISASDGVWDGVQAADLQTVAQDELEKLRKLQEEMSITIQKGRQAQDQYDVSVLNKIAQKFVSMSIQRGSGDDCTCEVIMTSCPPAQ